MNGEWILYPQLQQPVLTPAQQPEQVTESRWHQPWSEPIRLNPGLRSYLQQSFTLDTSPFPASSNLGWYDWFSEPVRQNPGLRFYLQQSDSLQAPVQPPSNTLIQWFSNLSEPIRIRPGIRASNQAFFFFEPEPPESMEAKWYAWLSEPVRQKLGLKAPYQQFLAYHPRILPNPNVTVTMAATEINQDIFLGAINVYNSGGSASSNQGAKVSISEVPDIGSDGMSIRES